MWPFKKNDKPKKNTGTITVNNVRRAWPHTGYTLSRDFLEEHYEFVGYDGDVELWREKKK